ncbi:MAG: VCBS repeat-containing protein [Planctomycetes bacterium]|nr:VCBS repeat-containing protein [Planctomycetota bacterium]
MTTRNPFVFLLFALVGGLAACGDDPKPTPPPATAESALDWAEASALNDRAILLMDQSKIGAAIPLFEELRRRTPADLYAPRFNLAVALLNSQNNDLQVRFREMARAEELFRQLVAESPDRVEARYTLAILLEHLGKDRPLMKEQLEACRRLAPLSADCAYRLGKFWFEEGGEHLGQAEELLLAALELDPQLVSAHNTLFGALRRLGEKERAAEALRIFRLYSDSRPERGRTLSLLYNGMGEYATCIRGLRRYDSPGDPAPLAIAFAVEGEAIPARAAGAETRGSTCWAPALHDLEGKGEIGFFVPDGKGGASLYGYREGSFVDLAKSWGLEPMPATRGAIFADLDHDDRPDLMVLGDAGTRLFRNAGARFEPLAFPDPQGSEAGTPTAAQVLDADLDGDLDLYLASGAIGTNPSRIFSNLRPTIYETDDPAASGFKDLGEILEKKDGGVLVTALWIDLDRDGDPDLVEGRADGLHFVLNDRLFRFRRIESATQAIGDGLALRALVAADLDQDGLPDLVATADAEDTAVVAFMNRGGLRFERRPLAITGIPTGCSPYPADLDNDGDPDLVLVGEDGTSLLLRNDGTTFATLPLPRLGAGGPAFHDLDRDGLLDLIFADPDSGRPRIAWNRTKDAGRGITLELRGKRAQGMAATWSTRFGTGASVEVAAAGRRVHLDVMTRNGSAAGTGPFLHVGLGAAERADAIRIVWPDLVLQNEPDGGDRPLVVAEVNRKASSCPVLFKPDGRGGFAFVTDFLGVGGLGFFMAPGSYAPPDRDETVRIGELLPIGDHYELRVHEPMEEISYLDRLSLVAIDHPAGTELQVDERLAVAEPMPSGRPILFGDSFLPRGARSDRGRDCLAELSAEDRIYQPDLELDPRFVGYLAREQKLELDFDAAAILAARPAADARLWLFLDGFVEYPYSHVNYAAWESGVRGRALSLDLRGDDGRWREFAAEIGYPAGMTRCMATELTAAVGPGLGSIRLRSNLDIRIDRVRLAWQLPDALMTEHRRAFTSAELRFVGYPEERSPDGKEPKLYDYQRMTPTFDWKVMGGRYSAFGAVTDQVRAGDDALVVMGHGEEIVLRLPVASLPPLAAGMQRTFLLEAEGYCKDMDPCTAFPDTVAPLPRLGLVDYPDGLPALPDRDPAPRERQVPGRLR